MNEQSFRVKNRYEENKAILDLQGEINGLVDAELNEAYLAAEKASDGMIVLNFSGVDYINSTGIALIVGLLAQARKTHRQLAVYGLSPHYQQIFTITRLADFMKIFPDETSVLQA
jgi:anti-anti-sigma factor